ncbi:MAG: lysylphosphatidylglycerol synthase transmembrane domain-containing protein [Gemmatimonadaceae bacterium]
MTASATASGVDRHLTRWVFLAAWVLLTIVLVATVPDLPWRRAVELIRRSSVPWLVAAVAANALIIPLWVAEWRLLVPTAFRVGFARMFEVVAVTAAVLNSVPFFAGEASAVALLIGRATLSRGAALSVLAMDQLLVGLAKLSVIAAAALAVPLPSWLRAGILSLVAGVATIATLLLLLAIRWSGVRDRLQSRPSKVRGLAARLVAWGSHLDALREPRRMVRLAALALAKKGAELLGVVAVQLAFGVDPSLSAALVVVAALAVTTLIPVAPANLGVYEATVFAAYRFLGFPAEAAVGLAIVQHVAFLLPALVIGYATLTVRQLQTARPSER